MAEDLYVAAWDSGPTTTWQARHGMTAASYQATFDTLLGQGYRLQCVSGYDSGGQAMYAAIWDQAPGPAWQARHGMTAGEYQATFNQLVGEGYRLRMVSGYEVAGQDYYAAIWDQASGSSWQARHGMSADEYQSTFNQLTSEGYRLLWVCGYTLNGGDLYAAMWDQSPEPGGWQARHRMTAADYVSTNTTLSSQGYRPICVSGYSFDGSDYFAGLWEQPTSPTSVAHVGMPSGTYQLLFNQLQGQGYRPYFVSGYYGLDPLEIHLDFEVQAQTESEWCWAAVATSVNHFYNPSSTVTQCQVVDHQLGRNDCCDNPSSSNCNEPGYLDQALQYLNNFASEKGQGSDQDIVTALDAGTPPCIRIGWAGGGGHFIGVNGCEPMGLIDVSDPIWGDVTVTVDTLTGGQYEGSGTWTNTYFTQA